MSELSGSFSERKNNKQKKHNIQRVAAVMAASATLFGLAGEGLSNAEPQYIARGTGQGMPGPEALPPSNERVDVGTPGRAPIVDLGFNASVAETSENYQRAAIAGPDNSSAVGYSSSAMALHEANTNPEAAANIDHNTYIGDPCASTGILRDPGVAGMVQRGCVGPNANPNAQEVYVHSTEDPIANWGQGPVSLVHAINMMAGYNMDHNYYTEPNTGGYTETRTTNGNTTVVTQQHDSSASSRYMKHTHNIDVPVEVEDFIQSSLPADQRSPRGQQNNGNPFPSLTAPALPSVEEAPAPAPIVETTQQPAAMPELPPAPVIEEYIAPVEQWAAPVEQWVAPVEEWIAPVEEYFEQPVYEAPVYEAPYIAPVEEWVAPVEQYVEEYVAPVQEQFTQVQEQFNATVNQFTPPQVAIPGLPW